MRLVPKAWHTETWICSIRGHVVPAARAVHIDEDDRRLGVELTHDPERRLGRCLRCDVWLEVPVPSPGDPGVTNELPPTAKLPKPRRGKVLQDAVLLRVIALNKALHALAFGLLAVALGVLRFKLPGLQSSARTLDERLRATVDQTGQAPSRDRLGDALHRVIGLHRSELTVLFVTAAIYCIIETVEAAGLWRERRWAEYLTVIATAGLLPFEIRELIARVTVIRVGALVVNMAILVWLVNAKHLFGVKGGHATLHEHVDWDEILAGAAPAAHR